MACLNRATKANYVIHDSVEAETSDREDHTFCGIMFPVKAKDYLPVDHIIINSIAVRGALGPLTVWVTKDSELGGSISCNKKHWKKLYEKTHPPSYRAYKELDLSKSPIVLKPGQVRGIYIHSTRRGDEAIVYDNKEKQKTHSDSFLTILPGRAHVSEKVFGSVPIWGWGSAWRDNREFVGQIKYGACYRLWNPSENMSFGGRFQSTARALFMCQRRPGCVFAMLPDDALYYILNMCRWDWCGDEADNLRREQKDLRRARRQRLAMEAQQMVEKDGGNEEMEEDADDTGDEDALGVDESDDVSAMEEDSDDDSEDGTNTSDSEDDEEEYHWGDHVGSRNPLRYRDFDSDSDASDQSDDEDGRQREAAFRRRALLQARRNIVHFLRSHGPA